MSRREARVMAMQILYTIDFNSVSMEEALKIFEEDKFDQMALEFVAGVLNQLEKIDSIISSSLENYTINRLNLVDKAIIRLATFELLSKTDKRIVINEALEITKEYSDQGDRKAVGFNNKVIDRICKKIEG